MRPSAGIRELVDHFWWHQIAGRKPIGANLPDILVSWDRHAWPIFAVKNAVSHLVGRTEALSIHILVVVDQNAFAGDGMFHENARNVGVFQPTTEHMHTNRAKLCIDISGYLPIRVSHELTKRLSRFFCMTYVVVSSRLESK
ncbi:hypothetical protein D3C81_1596620 [compost metagenome]